MIVKGTKQLGSFKRGVNLYIPKRKTSAAPSGIVVASTASVLVDGFALYKQSSTLYFGDVSEGIEDCGFDQTRYYGNRGKLEFSGGSWSYEYGPYNGCLNTWDFSTYTNPSANANFIPTTGWSSPITITAA